MSTYYLPNKPIPFQALKGLTGIVHEYKHEHTASDSICLTDDTNYIWIQKSRNGYSQFTRYGCNSAAFILNYLADMFNVEFVSEYVPAFEQLANGYDYVLIRFDDWEKHAKELEL